MSTTKDLSDDLQSDSKDPEPSTRESSDRRVAEAKGLKDDADILDAVSEYLFDLFDANCMDEYRRLDDKTFQII